MGQEVINNQGLHAFLRGCSDIQAAEIALIREPTTLDEAADYTKIAVSNHSMLMEFNRDKKPKTRQATFADENDNENQTQKDSFSEVLSILNKIESAVTQQKSSSTSGSSSSCRQQTPPSSPSRSGLQSRQSSPASPSRVRCYNCNNMGHYANNCPESQAEQHQNL